MSSQGETLYSLRRRVSALLIVLGVVIFALFVRLFYIQVASSGHLQSLAEDQWTRSLPIYAERGDILDTNGAILAKSTATYNLYSRAREIKNPSQTAEILAEILDIKFSKIIEKVSDKSVSELLISTGLDTETAVKITKKNLSGIYLTENSKRLSHRATYLRRFWASPPAMAKGKQGLNFTMTNF